MTSWKQRWQWGKPKRDSEGWLWLVPVGMKPPEIEVNQPVPRFKVLPNHSQKEVMRPLYLYYRPAAKPWHSIPKTFFRCLNPATETFSIYMYMYYNYYVYGCLSIYSCVFLCQQKPAMWLDGKARRLVVVLPCRDDCFTVSFGIRKNSSPPAECKGFYIFKIIGDQKSTQ